MTNSNGRRKLLGEIAKKSLCEELGEEREYPNDKSIKKIALVIMQIYRMKTRERYCSYCESITMYIDFKNNNIILSKMPRERQMQEKRPL